MPHGSSRSSPECAANIACRRGGIPFAELGVTSMSNGKVVVITGATSGIGRAAALEFAARGWHVVLGARRAEALHQVALDCQARGGSAVSVPTDVTIEPAVGALAAAALQQTGNIDVWVNNAGVTLFGSLELDPIDEHRQVIETNLFGAIYGARAALPVFRRQSFGVLINVSSVLGKIGQPFVPSYVISKFALRGLTEALRAELANEPNIHVCSLLPYAVDTEHFESGANHIGLGAHAMPPMLSPEAVARALVKLAEHPVRERLVPRVAVVGLGLHALLPRAVERTIFDALSKWHFGNEIEAEGPGNLYAPLKRGGAVHGSRPARVSAARLLLFGVPRLFTAQLELWWHALRHRGHATGPVHAMPKGSALDAKGALQSARGAE
jgi:NAD(P)-dependent dehydrogenase (short-subunit alcohol dehydrogenase family)